MRLLPHRADYPRFALWLYCIAWLVGNVALIVGFNGAGGEFFAACVFTAACAIWWGAYRLDGTKGNAGIVGFLVIGIWTLNFFGALAFSFHHYLSDFFFWISAAALVVLVIAVGSSKARPREKSSEQ